MPTTTLQIPKLLCLQSSIVPPSKFLMHQLSSFNCPEVQLIQGTSPFIPSYDPINYSKTMLSFRTIFFVRLWYSNSPFSAVTNISSHLKHEAGLDFYPKSINLQFGCTLHCIYYEVYIEQEAQTVVGSLEFCGHFSF